MIISVDQTVIGGRNVITLTTPVKHGLSQGDNVKLKNLSSSNGEYSVIRVGKDNGDMKEYCFSVDISEVVTLSNDGKVARMVRVVSGRPSTYYMRVFRKIKVRDGNEIENDDYEAFPLAFSQTIYEDMVSKYVFNEDIDISDLTDNLGRPLSELSLIHI